jgi:hypothetical protein
MEAAFPTLSVLFKDSMFIKPAPCADAMLQHPPHIGTYPMFVGHKSNGFVRLVRKSPAELSTAPFEYSLPINFLSDDGDVGTAVQAMRGGAVDIIEKPFESQLLRIPLNLDTHSI